MSKSRTRRIFITTFIMVFAIGMTVNVVAQVINNLRATNTSQLVVDANTNGLADGGDIIQYTVQVANCSGAPIRGATYQSDIDPNTSLIPNSITLTTTSTTLCGGTNNTPPVPTVPPPPVNPIVVTTTPADNTTEAAVDSNITLTFSENVTIAGDWFALVCTVSGTFNLSSANITVTGGPLTFTLDPTIDLQTGENCVVTVFATQVTDSESLNPLADFVFDFTTETPPTITATTPTNGATTVLNNADILITFDEPVTVTAASFTLECPAGTPFAGGFAVSGSGTNLITVNPTGNLPSGTTCQVVVVAANTSDLDPNDPPDLLDGDNNGVEGDDYTFSFTTDVDAAPTVTSINPTNGAVSVASNTTITITFSELVDIPSAAAFSIECPAGGPPQGFTVTTPATLPASTTTVVIDPASLLPDATTCQVTVFAASVTDTDVDEPPDNMAADFVSTFTTEAPPSVTTTTPNNGAVGVSTGTNITVNFDEPVNVTTSSFTIECPVGSPFTYTIAGSGTNSITLDPTTNLLANQTCTVTVVALQVADSDPIDPPDNMLANYVFTFDTVADTAPVASSPLDGLTNVATSTNIVINFNEPVDVTAGAFIVECPVGSPIAFTTIPALPTTNQTAFIIDPTTNLPATSTCGVTVLQANVQDTDTDEPPNTMLANYSFTFNTLVDLAPTVVQASIVPASTSTGANSASLNNPVSTTPTLTIPFSEAVNVATGGFTLVCNATPIAVTATPPLPAVGATSIDVSSTIALAEGANCTLTVVAANVADSDVDDPPNLMVTDFTLSFNVDTAPAETLTETEVGNVFQNVTGAGATNVDLDSDIRITFTEAVTVTFPANSLQCPAGNNIPVTVTTNNAATIVLNPNINLPLNTSCVLNIPSANISDVDTSDNPDNPVAGVNHTFTTVDDDAPTVTTNPAAGGSNIAMNSNITVTFNEPVTLTGAWFDLNCSVSGNRTSTGELTGTGITIIENTPDLVYTIDPTVDLAAGDVCTITLDSANAVDNDLIDSPNELDGDSSLDVIDGDPDDYVAVFSTTDAPPQVLNTTPINGAVTVPNNQVITLNFTEAINTPSPLAISWFCGATPILSSNSFTPTTATITPLTTLPSGSVCTFTLESTLVTDTDPVDPPNELDGDASNDVIDGDADDFTLTFTVDAEPTLLSTQVEIANVLSPAAGAVNVDIDTNIVLTFSEPVNAGLTSFDLECPAGADIAFTVLGTGTNTITIDPTPIFLPINTLCDLDIIAANITDVDAGDPPDTLPANVNLTFTTVNDNPPSLTSAEAEVSGVFTALPLGIGQFADTDTDLRLTFSEAVTVTGNWAELDCTTTGIQDVSLGLAVGDADPVFTLNPATNLTPGEGCTLTIFAAQVDDDDPIDPPANMVANAVLTFTVADTPPQVNTATSTPINGSIVPNTQTVTFNFTEMVDIQAGAISFVCNATPVAFTPALPQNNVTSIILTPTVALTNGAACVVSLESTLITDDDVVDGADELDGSGNGDVTNGDADDFTLNFAVDAQPTLVSAEAEVTNIFTALSFTPPTYADPDTNFRITFSEAVNPTGNWASLTCTLSLTQSVGGGTLAVAVADPVFTLNPNTNLVAGEDCTLTIFAAQVNDDDAFDPPANLPADAVYTFSVQDTPPQVVSTIPTASPTTPNNQTVTVNFSELVDIAAGGITWTCGVTPIAFTPALPQNNVTSIVLTPTVTLPAGLCTVTLESTLITDVDTVDAPNQLDGNNSNDIVDGDADDLAFTFTVDAPPQVNTATVEVAGAPTFLPLGGAQRADVDTNIVMSFTENVDATVAGVTLECPAGNPIPFAGLPVTNVGTITINPTSDLPGDTLCQVVVVTTDTTDTDAFDPPNQLDGNYDGLEGPSIGFSFTTAAVANDDAYTVTPHLTYTSPTGVRANDNPTTATITGFGPTLATANGTTTGSAVAITGGAVVLNADGTFIFYPIAGLTNTTVSFFYTITGGDTAQVTLTVENEELVWFVDNSPTPPPAPFTCSGAYTGTQACPSADLATVDAVDTNNDIIFIASGTYTCGITITNDEWIIGDGSSSDLATLVASRVTPVAGSNFAPYNTFSGTDPSLISAALDCFTLTSNNQLRGLSFLNRSAYAIASTVNIGTSIINEVNVTGTGGILNLTGGGTINANFETLSSTLHNNSTINLQNISGTITNTTASSISHNDSSTTVNINGGDVNFTYTGDISKTSSGRVIQVAGRTGGTFAVTGTITHTAIGGSGISVTGNSGTVTFNTVNLGLLAARMANNPLTINNNTGTINLGTVSVFTNNVIALDATGNDGTLNITNGTINATNGTAINIDGPAGLTTLGMTLTSISSTNATNGISIVDTNGTFTVTGTGVSGTGGVINNATADSILLNNVTNISLGYMNLTNSGQSHIDATNVTGLTLTGVNTDFSVAAGILGNTIRNLTITGGLFDRGGQGAVVCNVHGIEINNLLGTSSVTGATFRRSNTIQFLVNNTTATNAFPGAPDVLTVSGTNWNTHTLGGCFGDHLSIGANTGGNFRIITNNSVGVNTFDTAGIGVLASGNGSGHLDAQISYINTSNNTAGVGISATGNSNVTFTVSNNNMTNTGSLALAFVNTSTGTLSGTINNNTIVHNAGTSTDAMHVITEGNGITTVTIRNNDIRGNFQRGIRGQARLGTGVLNATIHNNYVEGSDAAGLQAIALEVGGSGVGHNNTVCLNLYANQASMPASGNGYRLFHRAGLTFHLQDFTGVGTNVTDVTNWVINPPKSNQNTVGGPGIVLVTGVANNFTNNGGGACPTP